MMRTSFFSVLLCLIFSSSLLAKDINDYLFQGADYHYQGKLDEAGQAFKQALQIESNNEFALNQLGLIYAKQEKFKEAVKLFRRVVQVSPENTFARVWLGILSSVGIFIVYKKPKILFLAVPVLVIGVLIMPASIKSRIYSIVDLNNETVKDRLYMVYTGWEIFKDHPFFGVGANNIENVYLKYKHPHATITNMHLHNNFLHTLAERGIFAFISLTACS